MKLFWGSIVFISVACFAPLAFAQNSTTYTANQNFNSTGSVGNFNTVSSWSNGVPNGAANSGSVGTLIVNNFAFGTINGVNFRTNNPLTVNIGPNQSAQGLVLEGAGNFFLSTGQGTINLPIASGAAFTITGNNLNGQPALLSEFGVTTTISGGTLNIQSGNIYVGDLNINGSGYTDGLNFTQTSVNLGSGQSIQVGIGTTNTFGFTTIPGVINQSQTVLTAGNNLTIQIGTPVTGVPGNGTYNLSSGSSITAGTGSVLQIGSGSLTQDSTSSINLGSGSTVSVGTTGGDNAQYNLAGSLTVTNTQINIGAFGSNGTFNQTSGSIGGTASVNIGGDGGLGTYNLSGGNAVFTQGFNLGQRNLAGTGVINQSGSSSLIVSGSTALIGTLGSGTYNLSGGSVDFQGGVTVGATGAITQTGGSLSSEGASTITGNYGMGGGSATFNNTLTVNGMINLSGGTLIVGRDNLLPNNGTGTINFNGGTLQLTGGTGATYNFNFGGTLQSGTSTIDVSATPTTVFTFANALTGAGGISLVGNGATNFFYAAAGNNYSGITSITNGQLNLNQADFAGSAALNAGPGGTLNLTLSAGGFAYNNPISGPGTLALNFNTAGDPFVMPNANNFTGTVVLGANGTRGTLQIYNGTFANIVDNATGGGSGVTIGGNSLYNGAVEPASGTVILPGANTYTGPTTINPNFTVRAANFSGNVINAGTISTLTYPVPPALISTPSSMTIAGSLNSTGAILGYTNGQTIDTYYLKNNGNTTVSTISGLIGVVGSGTKTYNMVQASAPGGIAIGPAGLSVNPPGTLFSYTVALDAAAQDIVVSTTQKPLIGFATTPSQRVYANGIDPLSQSPPPALNVLLTIMNGLPANQISTAIQQLIPQNVGRAPSIAFENSTFMVERVNSALSNLRSGYTGLDASGVSFSQPGFDSSLDRTLRYLLASNAPNFHTTAPNGVNYYPDDGGGTPVPSSDIETSPTPSRMTPGQAASPTTYNGQVMSDSPVPMHTSSPSTLRSSRFSEFVSGDVVLADIDSTPDAPTKANYTAGDIMAGVSFRMTSNLSIGMLFDYNHTNANTDSYGSKTIINSYTPGVFATYADKDFYANGLLTFGVNDYSQSRALTTFGPINGMAHSYPTGQQFTADVDLGYDFHPAKQWVFGPTLGLTYTHLNISSASESGLVSGDDWNYNSQSVDSMRSRLGGHVGYITRVGNIALQPNLTAMWQHEFIDNNPGISATLQGLPQAGNFNYPFVASAADSALLGCGLTATLDNSMAFYLNYLANVSGDGYFAQSLQAGVKGSF